MDKYIKESELEHRFWLQILGDHSRFIFNALSPKETSLIKESRVFIDTFDRLLKASLIAKSANEWHNFAKQVYPLVVSLRGFKIKILTLHLKKMVSINLPPTFFNHMLNELEEYLQNLCYLTKGHNVPTKSPVHHHLLWILDAQGHADSLYNMLDPSQTKERNIARQFQELWGKKYLEATEFAAFLRTGLTMFPALGDFDKVVSKDMFDFKKFLETLKYEALKAETLGTFDPLIPDHMAREECYYLIRLYQGDPGNVSMPKCDPAHPRFTG